MSFDIGSGSHMLKWAYTKDEYVKAGSDCGWLDKVVFYAHGEVCISPQPQHWRAIQKS